jgi:DNA-binding NarL/FixJ family response regulator
MIRVLIVDDQKVLREGLKVLLSRPDSDLTIVGAVENGKIALESIEPLRPDVVLMDLDMPVMDGLTATKLICQRYSDVKVLILSGCEDEEILEKFLRVGARGYFLKDTSTEDLIAAIQAVARGHVQFGPGIFDKLMARVMNPKSAPPQEAMISLPPAELISLPAPVVDVVPDVPTPMPLDSLHPSTLLSLADSQAFRALVNDCSTLRGRMEQLFRNFDRIDILIS